MPVSISLSNRLDISVLKYFMFLSVPLCKIILITPPMASEPYIALCEPLKTSILSTPVNFNL